LHIVCRLRLLWLLLRKLLGLLLLFCLLDMMAKK
jgi:hypothetical protein